MADNHFPVVTAQQLHEASDAMKVEPPTGTAAGAEQSLEIRRFMDESTWTVMEFDGSFSGVWNPDMQSLGLGLMIGLVAGRQQWRRS